MSDLFIIGLGNPGTKYEGTRHNIGWEVLDHIIDQTYQPNNSPIKSQTITSKVFGSLGSIFDSISNSNQSSSWESSRNVLSYKVSFNNINLDLIKPQTYMNNSGIASFDYLKYRNFKLNSIKNLVVIYDDLDLPCGKVKVKKSGSSGGHRGLQNILDVFKKHDFTRIKIGIGHPKNSLNKQSVNSWVLSRPSSEDRLLLDQAVSKAAKMVTELV